MHALVLLAALTCTPAIERPFFAPHPPSPSFSEPTVRSLVAEEGALRIDVDLPRQTTYLRIVWGERDLWMRPTQREVCIPPGLVPEGKARVLAVNSSGDASGIVWAPVKIISMRRSLGWGIVGVLVGSPIVAGLVVALVWLIRRHRRASTPTTQSVPPARISRA